MTTIIIKKENNDVIDKEYVKRDFIIKNIDAMIENHNHRHYNDAYNRGYNQGIIVGLLEVRNEIENLYNPPVF